MKENPLGFSVVGSSLGEGVTSPSLGLSHAGRLFLLVVGPLSIARHLFGPCPSFPKAVSPLCYAPLVLTAAKWSRMCSHDATWPWQDIMWDLRILSLSPYPCHPREAVRWQQSMSPGANTTTASLSSWAAWL